MKSHFAVGLAPCRTASQRKWQSHSDQKRKGRLNQVMKRTTNPCGVSLLPRQKMPESTFWTSLRYPMKLQNLRHHQEHYEPAVSVNGGEPEIGRSMLLHLNALRLFGVECVHWELH